MSKLTEVELKLKHHQYHELNPVFDNSVSFSQYQIYRKCPYQWYLSYYKKLPHYAPTIHTVFGTAIHETLQNYLDIMYNGPQYNVDEIDLAKYFKAKFTEVYQKEFDKHKKHFTNAEEMGEFFEDGLAILEFFKQNRHKYFSKKDCVLLGIEIPLIVNLSKNLYLKGFVDLVIYDKTLDKVFIYDIKTSGRGWGDKEKKDKIKTSQLIIYKQYFSKLFNIDINKIEVEFFIVKRKIWESSDFEIGRVQRFKPANGKNTLNKVDKEFKEFLINCFDSSGKPKDQSYIKIVSKDSCYYCPYKDDKNLCDKIP